MIYAIFHLVMCGLVVIIVLQGETPPDGVQEMFSTNTLLLCFGIISVCNRLDKIIKKLGDKHE